MRFEYAMGTLLIKGGCVLTQDAGLGDYDCADILIDQDRIVALAPTIPTVGTEVIDASGMIVLPGFVDTHRHTREAVVRNIGVDLERVRSEARRARDANLAANRTPAGCRPL